MQKTVQWYPGHMFKAKKEIIAQLKNIDLVVEIVDSRCPLASHNEMLEELTNKKKKLVVFSKKDYVDSNELEYYVGDYRKRGYDVIAANFKAQKEREKVLKAIRSASAEIKEKFARKGINKTVRVLIMGMPNVGKSTLINLLVGKNKVNVGNKPGVTKTQQWIGVGEDIELLDTPGILVPKIENIEDGYRLVLCQLIKDEVVHIDDVAVFLLENLYFNYKEKLVERYNMDLEIEYDIEELYNAIAKSIGALLRGNEYDYDRVSVTLINDFRKQKFGRILLDERNN